LRAKGGENFSSRADADIRGKQRCFELRQNFGVNWTIAGENLFDFGRKLRPRLGDGLLQPFEKRGLGFSEQRNHNGLRTTAEPFILAERFKSFLQLAGSTG
jgi:hypothetical protein